MNYPQNTTHNLYVLRSVSRKGDFGFRKGRFRKRLVLEMLRKSYQDVLGRCVEIGFPVPASAKTRVNQSSVLDNFLRNVARSLEECAGVAHSISIKPSVEFREV